MARAATNYNVSLLCRANHGSIHVYRRSLAPDVQESGSGPPVSFQLMTIVSPFQDAKPVNLLRVSPDGLWLVAVQAATGKLTCLPTEKLNNESKAVEKFEVRCNAVSCA